MSEIKYISYDQLRSYYENNVRFVKFKEWIWDGLDYKPSEETHHIILNLDKAEYIKINYDSDLVRVYYGEHNYFFGKFFI